MNITDYAVPVEDRVPFVKFMAYIAQVDSAVTPEEKQVIDNVLMAWNLSEDIVREVYDVLENGADLEALCGQFKNRKSGYLLVQELITLAILDGCYDETERSAVIKIATCLGVSRSRMEELEQWVRDGVEWREKGLALIAPEGE